MESSKKKAILIFCEWYLPGRKAGGPVKSIESLVWAMRDYFDFYIFTTNTDLGEFTPYKNIELDQWISNKDGSKIYYIDKYKISKNKILKVIHSVSFQYIYINSLYSKWFSIIPLRLYQRKVISCDIVLAPRGMLSVGALKIKSFKKKSFIFISRLIGLHKNIKWHATSKTEESEIKKYFGNDVNVSLVQNFSKPINTSNRNIIKKSGELHLFYLSRVSEVKNLHIALESLYALNNPESRITYDIYGNLEDVAYYKKCLAIVNKLSSNIKVEFKGELKGENIFDVIKNYHFLFLPTSNENFGHSIIESLQCGIPVIISNKTPWRNLQEYGCGWDVEPTVENYTDILNKCLVLESIKMQLMGKMAMHYTILKFDFEENKYKTLELFN